MSENIIVIGGGPIGCWTALQAKRRDPNLNIRVYERYEEYQRDHMLSIRRETLKSGLSGSASDKAVIADILAANHAAPSKTDKSGLPPSVHIQIQDLEKILKRHCTEMGVRFTYAKIQSPQDVMARHPQCDLFIAADGAKSMMRAALLGEESTDIQDLLYSVDVKYAAHGQAKYTKEPTYDKINMVVVETIGKEQDSQSQVALRFLLDKASYDKIPEATFKNPLKMSGWGYEEGKRIHRPSTIGAFENDIRNFQAIRQKYTNENRVHDSESVTKITLSQYASKKFSVMAEGDDKRRAGWFFVGDAAMGMPFYRSINAGMTLGAKLGNLLADPKTSAETKSKIYESQRSKTIRREFSAVSRRLTGINLYRHYYRPAIRAATWTGIGLVGIVTLPLTLPLLGLGYIGVRLGIVRLM